MLYIETPTDRRQVDGNIFDAERIAAEAFQDPRAAILQEEHQPNNNYVGKVWRRVRGEDNRMRNILSLRVSTEGFQSPYKF